MDGYYRHFLNEDDADKVILWLKEMLIGEVDSLIFSSVLKICGYEQLEIELRFALQISFLCR